MNYSGFKLARLLIQFSILFQNTIGLFGCFVKRFLRGRLPTGCFFDALSMLVLTLPFVAPIINELGFDRIWFGVLYVVLAEIGLVTPPYGLNLFVLNGVVPQYEITTIFMGTLPLLIPTLILVALVVLFPDLVLWLPGIIY